MEYSILVNDEIDEIAIVKGKPDKETEFIMPYPEDMIPDGEKAALISARWGGVSVMLYGSFGQAEAAMLSEMNIDLRRYSEDIDFFEFSDYTASIYFYSEAGFTWRIVEEEDLKSIPLSALMIYRNGEFKTSQFNTREGAKKELLKRLKDKEGFLRSMGPTCAAARIGDVYYFAGCGKDLFTSEKLLAYFDEKEEEIAVISSPEEFASRIETPHRIYTREELLDDELITI